MRAELVEDAGRLEGVAREWDELAVAGARPYASPHWLLPWWQALAPPGARLATVVVRDREAVAGIAPFFVERRGLGARAVALGRGVSAGVEPLAREGAEDEVARLAAAALADAAPVLFLDAVPAGSRWPGLLAAAWPGAARLQRTVPAPVTARPEGGYEAWFAARSGHFRKRMRRAARELDERGAAFRLAGPDTFERDLEAFARLHEARWAARGGSSVLTAGVEPMLLAAARRLGPERFRLWLLELEGRPVCAEILVAAGGTASFWLGGFEPEHAALQPSLQTMLHAIEHAFRAGDGRIDLGEGGQEFKYRLADGERELAWFAVVGRGARTLPAKAELAAGRLRRAAARTPLGDLRRRLLRRK
ncbi:MAG TPA: GNAT family N-acetyltransferase [Gaiellaceae bacterium]|jgi:CelD/BcsL family acetyltransferase involved in cellulose biosynthesis|nr:GNAT family N-acetyltransferase [Gaiellaceae bacterium]